MHPSLAEAEVRRRHVDFQREAAAAGPSVRRHSSHRVRTATGNALVGVGHRLLGSEPGVRSAR